MSYDSSNINVTLINKYNKLFVEEKKNFSSKSSNAYKSYLSQCSDLFVKSMATNLKILFNDIENGYKNISDWWESYISNITSMEKYLSENAKASSVSESSIKNFLDSKLSDLPGYDSDLKVINTDTKTIPLAEETINKMTKDMSSSINSSNLINETGKVKKKSVGATIGTGTVSILEGLLTLGEDGKKFLMINGNKVYSFCANKLGFITDAEVEERKKEIMKKTSENFWEDEFDFFYDNNQEGKILKQKSYGFDTVRKIGNKTGKVIGILSLGSVGGSAAAGVEGSTATTVGLNSAKMSIAAGIDSFSETTSTAWNENASYEEGIKAGVIRGINDGLNWYIGGKMAGFNSFSKEAANAATRIGVDTVLGASEGVVDPFIKSTYRDGYYDSNGNYVKYTESDDALDRYKTTFDSEGGMKNVALNAGIATIMSGIGEAGGLAKFKNSNSAKTDVETLFATENLYDKVNILNKENDKYAFANSFFKSENNLIKKAQHISEENQKQWIRQMNEFLSKNESAVLKIKSSKEITSEMLRGVDDLSRLKVQIDGGFRDLSGNFRTKYNSEKYLNRITYTGYEAFNIVSKLEELELKVDKSLPIRQRAEQIYNILSTEIPVMHDHGKYIGGNEVSQSLRGLTQFNEVGKDGLICAGYSQAFKELCNRCGIECDYIRGYAVIDVLTGKGGKHAWNAVLDGDTIIPVDVTWKASTGKNWFNNIKEFNETHIADRDEMFKEFKEKVSTLKDAKKFNNDSNNNSESIISKAIDVMDNKYGVGQGIKRLEALVASGDYNKITRTDNARQNLMNIPLEEIKNYLHVGDSNSTISKIFKNLNSKYSTSESIDRLNQLVKIGDYTVITRENNARYDIQNIPISDIKLFLDKKSSLDSVINTMTSKYGYDNTIKIIKEYVKNGKANYITRTNGCRNIVESLKKSDIITYMDLFLNGGN